VIPKFGGYIDEAMQKVGMKASINGGKRPKS